MKTQILNHSLPFGAAALLAFGLFAPLTAQGGSRSGTIAGRRGGVYHREVSHTPGRVTASGSATLPDGRTASRSFVSQQTDTGRTTSARATGFNGRTATYDSTRTRTDTGYARQVSATGANGGTATKEITVSHQNGKVTRTVTTTATPGHP